GGGPGAGKDIDAQANEYNLESYNTFLNSAMIQFGTKIFHDRYCKEGLIVSSEVGYIGRIYGDANMMKGDADNGVEKSAQTAKDSQDAIFAIVQGKKPPKTPEQIKAQYPSKAK